MIAKKFPAAITSYDLLKSFALITMIIDHIGFYFFPDMLWWRAVGRLSAPAWFFLIGYAKTRDIPALLIAGALILTLGNIVTGMPLLSFNVLISIALIRLLIDPVMRRALRTRNTLWGLSLLLFFLILPTSLLTEYGTMGLITAMLGYMVRHRKQIDHENLLTSFLLFTLITYIVLAYVTFGFSSTQFLFVSIGTAALYITLFYFRSSSFPKLTERLPGFATALIHIGGRRTLEIYVLHLIAFKFTALYLGLENFALFQPTIIDW